MGGRAAVPGLAGEWDCELGRAGLGLFVRDHAPDSSHNRALSAELLWVLSLCSVLRT